MSVPLDWSRPHGRTITLAVGRYLARDQHAVIGTLFFNPGGPGVSGVDTLHQSGSGLETLVGNRFNIVSWDLRGSGGSTAVRCSRGGPSTARFFGSQQIPTSAAASRQ